MVTQNPLTQARKLKLRWFIALSTLPLLAVVSAFGIIPQSDISFAFNQNKIEEIALPASNQVTENTDIFWRIERIQRGDTVTELLRRLNVDDVYASEYLRKDKAAESLHQLSYGKDVQAETSFNGSLISLRYINNNGNQVIIEKKDDLFITHTLNTRVEKRIFMRTGEIISTLFAAFINYGKEL